MRTFRIALAQINPVVGDLPGNRNKIISFIKEAKSSGADLIAFPEMSVTGYPTEDLLLKPRFIEDNLKVLAEIAGKTTDITAIVGFVDKAEDIFNAAAVLNNKEVRGIYHKIFLPNYGVFDENRYFQAGSEITIFTELILSST